MKTIGIVFLLITSIISAQNETLIEFSNENNKKYSANVERLKVDLKNGKIVSDEVLKGITYFDEQGLPLYVTTQNEDAGKSSNVDQIWNLSFDGTDYLLDGTGMIINMWDENQIRATHVELTGRITNSDPGGISYHSTAVAGTIAASGVNPLAKGMAPNISVVGGNYGNYTTKIPAAVNAKVSNNSFGVPTGWSYQNSAPAGSVNTGAGWYFFSDYSVSNTESNYLGNYTEIAVFWDDTAYLAPEHIIVKSAGNSQGKGPNGTNDGKFYWDGTNFAPVTGTVPENNCGNGYDCLILGSASKNIIVVGAVNQLTTPDYRYSQPSDIQIANFSSLGPRDDGGIKPDIVAVGTGMFTPIPTNDTSYESGLFGTSFSSPVVAGIMALWDRLYFIENGVYMRSDLAKAILCNSANECGANPGPDYKFGWGLINALEGANTIVDVNSKYIGNETLNNGAVYEKTILASGTEPLKVTISWLDPSATPIPNSINDRTSRLVNDLDLRIVKISDNSETMPWKLDPNNPSNAAFKGDNTVDNVEQVIVESPEANAEYKIIVSHKGTLLNNDGNNANFTNFGIAASGLQQNMSVDDIDGGNLSLEIYPNPASDYLNIDLNSELSIKSISIFDSQGKMLQYTNTLNEGKLDVSKYPSGVYLVYISTEKGKVSKTFIKK